MIFQNSWEPSHIVFKFGLNWLCIGDLSIFKNFIAMITGSSVCSIATLFCDRNGSSSYSEVSTKAGELAFDDTFYEG